MPKRTAQIISGVFVLLVLLVSGLNFAVYFLKTTPVRVINREVTVYYWEEMISQFPTFGEAYLELAKEHRALGRDGLARSFEMKAAVLGVKTEK